MPSLAHRVVTVTCELPAGVMVQQSVQVMRRALPTLVLRAEPHVACPGSGILAEEADSTASKSVIAIPRDFSPECSP